MAKQLNNNLDVLPESVRGQVAHTVVDARRSLHEAATYAGDAATQARQVASTVGSEAVTRGRTWAQAAALLVRTYPVGALSAAAAVLMVVGAAALRRRSR